LTVTYLGASKSFALTITPAAAAGGTAAFLKTDSTTIGFWKGVYGADGFELAGDSSSDPSYVTVTHSGNSSYNWSAVTTDPRALQKAASTTDRIAACWCSSTSFSIDLSFHDANVHQVAMYMLDWEPLGRAERVDILDANNNLTLPGLEPEWSRCSAGHRHERFVRRGGKRPILPLTQAQSDAASWACSAIRMPTLYSMVLRP
jgi:hypothetical protein